MVTNTDKNCKHVQIKKLIIINSNIKKTDNSDTVPKCFFICIHTRANKGRCSMPIEVNNMQTEKLKYLKVGKL